MNGYCGTAVEDELRAIYGLFFDGIPVRADVIDTSRGETDFRKTVIVETADGEKAVLKIAANDFTFPAKIRVWQRTAEEYRRLGYYCPRIYNDRDGTFPTVEYQGYSCVAYAEEFSRYRSLEDRTVSGGEEQAPDCSPYRKEIWRMTARIAAKKFSYSDYPSAWCLYETFCPSDRTDEVLENALEWKKYADALPKDFSGQVRRIWERWSNNREALKEQYASLPTSVFQADLNASNLLVDEEGRFRGVCDFNLCGKDVFLNYLMRENFDSFEREIGLIREALQIASEEYVFTEKEKAAALPLYRCLKPLWYSRVEEMKEAGDDRDKIRHYLDQTEHYLTAEIDFVSDMG